MAVLLRVGGAGSVVVCWWWSGRVTARSVGDLRADLGGGLARGDPSVAVGVEARVGAVGPGAVGEERGLGLRDRPAGEDRGVEALDGADATAVRREVALDVVELLDRTHSGQLRDRKSVV